MLKPDVDMPSMTIRSQGRPFVTGSSFVPVPMEQVAAAWPRRLFNIIYILYNPENI